MVYVRSLDVPRYNMKISALNSLKVVVWLFQAMVDFHSFLTPTARYLSATAFILLLLVTLCQASCACNSSKYLSSSSGWVSLKEGTVRSPHAGKFANGIILMAGGCAAGYWACGELGQTGLAVTGATIGGAGAAICCATGGRFCYIGLTGAGMVTISMGASTGCAVAGGGSTLTVRFGTCISAVGTDVLAAV